MRLFHASDYDEAMAIQSGGFRDRPRPGGPRRASGSPTARRHRGSPATSGWCSRSTSPRRSRPRYEREAGEEGRRFLMPAELLNRYGPPVAEGDWSE